MNKGKNIILADCEPGEIEEFRKGLEESTGLRGEVVSKVSNWGRTSKWSDIKRYFMYFALPFLVFIRRKQYRRIVGWQQFYALNFALFCRVFHVKKRFMVSAINYTYKKKNRLVGKLYHCYMKFVVSSKYIDHLMVPSREYIDVCAKQLGIRKQKIHTLCFGVPDLYNKYRGVRTEEVALSIGRSNRDYDWLINEWKDIDYPLVIISDTYTPPSQMPSNITIISDVSGDAQYPYIMKSRVVILPIYDPCICSGDTVLLTAMSFKKSVIVTEPSTLSEMYIEDGQNGYTVKKAKGELKKCVATALERECVGEQARQSFLMNYSRRSMGKSTGQLLMSERRRRKTDLGTKR